MGALFPRESIWNAFGVVYQLEGTNNYTWEDLAAAFYRQYQYNADLAPTHVQLQGMTMGSNEGFKEYA